MNIKLEVEQIIRKRWDSLKNAKELVSLYSIEKQTNQGYNGRQLLELFQNCEDESASKVRILLDTDKCLLEISNDGPKAFSIKGYDSIFYPGLSSKVSSGYIGNKGLGFRSIINWADEIRIISNGFRLVFNTAFKKEILLNKIGYTEDDLDTIRKARKLNTDVYPIPLLNCCKILDLEEPHRFTTTISIQYKKSFEDSIIEQLKSISPKTLLFLQNINTIEIEGDVLTKIISVMRKDMGEGNFEVDYQGETYYVLTDDGAVDDDLVEDRESSEPKSYSVKIAYNDDLSFRDEVIYNYFKTQIPFKLPFVVHASLELDQNRNHSTESKVNPFILDKLFQLQLRFIEILKNKLRKSWLPYQTINNDAFPVYQPYSDIIDDYWGNFEVYPTLSGQYSDNNRAKDLGNGFASFLAEHNLEEYFGEQIVTCDLDINIQAYIDKPVNYVNIIESIAKDLDFQKRATFIKIILENYPKDRFSVLIDESSELIGVDDFVYTDKTSENKDLRVPTYSRIRFLHPALYQNLILELNLQSDSKKPRALKDKLERISDVHSFEPQTVVKKIISETNEFLQDKDDKKRADIILEFYQILFHNFKLREENPKLDYDSKVPCLNQLNDIKDIRELVLSEEFEMGRLSNKIFGTFYESEYIICSLEHLGLVTENADTVDEFVRWLGINPISIIKRNVANIDGQYINYINTLHDIRVQNYELFTVKHFKKIFAKTDININHIIAWVSLDEKIKKIFNNFTAKHSTKERLSYSYYVVKSISHFNNYIYYSIQLHFDIDNYLITNKKEEWFNPFKIDYDYLKDINDKLDKSEVDRILAFFGAKKDFNDLEINYLAKKTKELADRKNPKGAQMFYKSLVGHYRQNEKTIPNASLYATQGNDTIVKHASDIYFSDRIQLPAALTDKFPILYYPSRSGGATAIEMFGLKNLNDLDLKIVNAEVNGFIKEAFESFIKEIKPFILAFRLDKITKEDVKKLQVQRLNKLKVNCFSKLACSLDEEQFEIEQYGYVFSNDQFYIRIPSDATISGLRQNKQFIDNLSDVFLKIFDTLDEKKTFESILKQSREDNIYDVNNELAEGILEEAKILLGEISVRLSIWKSIFKMKKISEIVDLNDNNLDEYVLKYFPEIENEKSFNSDDSLNEIRKIRKIFRGLAVDLEEYNAISDYKLTFDELYQKELTVFYETRKKNLKNQLWQYLAIRSIDEQGSFLRYLHNIEKLLEGVILNRSLSGYHFNQIILDQLTVAMPFMEWEMDNSEFADYDLVEQVNIGHFTNEEVLRLRRNERLNSLSYFDHHIFLIKAELFNTEENKEYNVNSGFSLDINRRAELIEAFEIELSSLGYSGNSSDQPWLGGNNELTPGQKKTLGTDAEEVVKKYLDDRPNLYQLVEHISKMSEGEHYDIKYFDVKDGHIKYVECKYYNGVSFLLSREEKSFADKNHGQYEIWLVNKDTKIFCIKDMEKLGKLQPVNYKVNIKLKEYAIMN